MSFIKSSLDRQDTFVSYRYSSIAIASLVSHIFTLVIHPFLKGTQPQSLSRWRSNPGSSHEQHAKQETHLHTKACHRPTSSIAISSTRVLLNGRLIRSMQTLGSMKQYASSRKNVVKKSNSTSAALALQQRRWTPSNPIVPFDTG